MEGSSNDTDSGSGYDLESEPLSPPPYQHLNLNSYLPEQNNKIGLTDDALAAIKVKELNKNIKSNKELGKEEIKQIKTKRRRLKNRGYAKGTRDNKSSEVNELEREKRKIEKINCDLEKEMFQLEAKLHQFRQSNKIRQGYIVKDFGVNPEELDRDIDSD